MAITAGSAGPTILRSPFRYFKTSPEIIRLAVMMYVRFPLSLRNGEAPRGLHLLGEAEIINSSPNQ